jgi:GGDEF-like domain/PucR C-terminal helix-turn-helix domain
VTRRKDSQDGSPEAIRIDLAARLRARAAEIEQAIFTRIKELSEPIGDGNPAYIAGLRSAVAEASRYGVEAVEKGREEPVPIPPETAKQARRAAREGVRLDTVLRRYAAGAKSLEEFIMAEADGIPSDVLCLILSDQGPQVDRLMESVSAEYRDELEQTRRSSVQKQADRILHFLESSSLVGPADVDYDFDHYWHIGMVLTGPTDLTTRALRALADRLGCRLLNMTRDRETVWVWLGRSREPDMAEVARLLSMDMPEETSVAIGEPRQGLDGWRQTFREAQTALQVMLYRPQPVTRCRDVILVSAIVRDPALARSLVETFLAPLDGRSDSGEVLKQTLRAYFKADQNANTAASILGVNRHTVERRLRSIEKKLGQTLNTCGSQLQVALCVEELSIASDQAI